MKRATWVAVVAAAVMTLGLAAQQVSPELYSGLRWRNIGPFRAGRVASVTGVIGQPGVFYIGLPLGGVWKTVSAGEVWYPVSDALQGADSIGAIAVAPSDANIIYAGTGDLVTGGGINTGDGMYKSTDAGKTWTHIGLEGTQHINAILVDPKDPNLVLASTQGDLRHPGPDRGVYRTTDGGQNWTQVLHPDDSTGARDMAWAFDDPSVVFAATIADVGGGGGFGGGGRGAAAGPNRTALYKSTDEGATWSKVTGSTVPDLTGRTGVAVAMHTHGQRIFWIGNGLYRSDDGGATWRQMAANDSRIRGSGYICGVYVDSQNPDIVYTMATSFYRSTDGGQSFVSWKGAPGGDDNHVLWIDPTNGQRMLLGADQGGVVSLDGGRTWSSWYNQATDQVYRITTDTRYPYWVLASQQDSGSTMIRSRSDFGRITPLDWWPLPASEFGSIASDPLNPDIIYAQGYGPSGSSGSVTKISQSTGQWENVGPNVGPNNHYRQDGNARRMFDPTFDKHALYMAYQCLVVTRDGGMSWRNFSPDVTVAKGQPELACGAEAAGTARGRGAGVAAAGRGGRGADIADFAISTVRPGVFWTGSSNGQVYNTLDNGLHWTNVTNFTDLPEGNNPVVGVEAGHFDTATAYVAVDRHTEGDYAPYIWRTHDGGKTWTRIVNGLPTDDRTGDFVRVIRENPKQKGLLFCGTETTVYVSFDDGDQWQSLRLNLPTTSIRDMTFHTGDHMNDLVIGTYGRSFWVLDDMSPLRELATRAQAIASAPAYLFKPGDAIRARQNINWDTPFPPEVPEASNPPFGALIYYHLSQPPSGEVKLQIYDSAGSLVRTLSSTPASVNEPPPPVPSYWLATPESLALPTAAGTNRTHWDLRYDDPPAVSHDIENQMFALPHQTTYGPHGPLALPGTYTVKLTVDGQTYSQPLVVRNDPRIGESPAIMAALRSQHRLEMLAYQAMKDSFAGNAEVAALREQVQPLLENSAVGSAAHALEAKLTSFGGNTGGGRGRGAATAPGAPVAFSTLNGNFSSLISPVTRDMAATQPQIQAWEGYCQEYNRTVTAWSAVQSQDVAGFNRLLQQNGMQPLTVETAKLGDPSCTFAAPAAAK